jgi:Helicase HerA, central domain
VKIPSYGPPVLITGTSGGGKSKLAGALLEQLVDQEYQFCIIDPEGDYRDRAGVTELGDADHAPSLTELLELLALPRQNAAVNLLGVPLADRPVAFEAIALRLHELRVRLGRPHWVVVDEAHHVMPDQRPEHNLPPDRTGLLLITVHPEHVASAVLADVKVVVVVGATPRETLAGFATAVGEAPPDVPAEPLPDGEAWVWFRGTGRPPLRIHAASPRAERRRHLRKYAAGELGPDKSFYFRGADGKLNLRVQNLQVFVQTADGVDDGTWTHHLRQGDYSRWFREAIKDEGLAREAADIEADEALTPAGSRARIRAAIESRYTAAA